MLDLTQRRQHWLCPVQCVCTLLSPCFVGSYSSSLLQTCFMDSFAPGFAQIWENKDKLISPALGLLEKLRGIVGSRTAKARMERDPDMIELRKMPNVHKVSALETPIDRSYTNDADTQRERIRELLNQNTCRDLILINGPSFPSEPPNRPKARKRTNLWQFGFFGLLLLFIATVAPLTTLLVRRSLTANPTPSSPVRQQQAVSTVTETTTHTDTTTRWNNSVLTTTRLTMSTLTEISIQTSTYTQSKVAKSTGIGKACDDAAFFLAAKNCVMVTECTQPKLDTAANDCKDLCKVKSFCKKEDEDDMSQRQFDCCSHCDCF